MSIAVRNHHPPVALALVLALAGLPAWAQSTTVEGGKIVARQPDQAIAFELIGDTDFDAFNVLLLGRADPGGSIRADVDFKIVDPLSSLSTTDPSLEFNASGATLVLGSGSVSNVGADGDLLIQDGAGSTTIELDGGSANAIQMIDPGDVGVANGFIKAWAKIEDDGSIASCWNCNTDTLATRRLDTGEYQVDFLIGDISSRPVLATVGTHSSTPTFSAAVIRTRPSFVVSSVIVETQTYAIFIDGTLFTPPVDRSFTLLVF